MQPQAVIEYFSALQKTLAEAVSALDGGAFMIDDWQSALGQGRTMVLSDSGVFERAGVNYSVITGSNLPPAASRRHPELAGCGYRAGGVSAVLHPKNPYCPTAHMNVRWFCVDDAVWWFGGGMDLTPYYGFVDDCRHFHHTCRDALAAVDESLYPRFKQACDDYFFIKHRNEARGIGGIFFDDFNEGDFAHSFAVMRSVGDAFAAAYLPLVKKRHNMPYGDRQRQWQQYRRGRYVEFNLVYDRGTLFGLQSGGRVESILMSLPPLVRWGALPNPPTVEETALLNEFLPPCDWLSK